ncbi:MAG TPA: carboxypeptidase regulatory-like domain-containing protein [Longimicrobiales bacterium]|nr:carboxypeptidase regulatory-like domain-containing protein [Longimicrobiales bacterium]
MSRWPVSVLAAAVMALLPSIALAQETPQPVPAGRVRVIVSVSDQTTNQRVNDAEVLLVAPDSSLVRPGAQSDGRYAFPLLDHGRYQLVVRRFGFREVQQSLDVGAEGDLNIGVALVPEAFQLEPLVITTPAPRNPFMDGFDERRAMGIGTYLTRDIIEQIRPINSTDILQMVAGTYIVTSGSPPRADVLLVNPNRGWLGEGPCKPAVFVNGLHLARMEGDDTTLNELIAADQIEAIEVYRPFFEPLQFTGLQHECGSIVIWTRVDPPPRSAAGFLWKPALAGVLFFVITNWIAHQ